MTFVATCHCGGTRLEFDRPPRSATQCNCSFCTKRGAIWGYYTPDEVRVVRQDMSGLYAPSQHNQHYFCANCGCGTYSNRPHWELGGDTVPQERLIAINLRLLDDFDIEALPIHRVDGRNGW